MHRQVDINFRPPNTSFVLCPSNGSILRSIRSMLSIGGWAVLEAVGNFKLFSWKVGLGPRWCLPPIRLRQILGGGIGEKIVAVPLMETEVSNRQGTTEVVDCVVEPESLVSFGSIIETELDWKLPVAAGYRQLLQQERTLSCFRFRSPIGDLGSSFWA